MRLQRGFDRQGFQRADQIPGITWIAVASKVPRTARQLRMPNAAEIELPRSLEVPTHGPLGSSHSPNSFVYLRAGAFQTHRD